MTKPDIEILGIYLEPRTGESTRVGTLIKDAHTVRFIVDSGFIQLGPERPILTAAFWAPGDEAQTVRRLNDEELKVSRAQHLPPYFANILPEGDLRSLIQKEMPADEQDEFSLLARLGTDLPGAVVAKRERDIQTLNSSPIPPANNAVQPQIKFSLAGVQLKFSMLRADHKLVMPASGSGGNVIVKLEPKDWPHLCEAEYLGMRLAEAAGVRVARAELVPSSAVAGIRRELIQGAYVLAVDRFDRDGDVRIHMEEFAPILGKVGDAKYSGNIETIVNLIARFSADPQESVLEAIRRIAVEVLIGNGDAHLKNWAFLYPGGQSPTLSPAYDIVPTILFLAHDELALKLGGSTSFMKVTRKKFARLAAVAELPEALVLDELDMLLERCMDAWPQIVRDVPLPSSYRERLAQHWTTLAICDALPNPFRIGPAIPLALVQDDEIIAEINDVRPARPNPTTELARAFTVPGTAAIDIGRIYSLESQDRKRTEFEIRSLRPTQDNRTRVVARSK